MKNKESTAITTAFELDRTGRFAEAMETLRSASLQGDLPAMSELAHRLLIGDRAPKSPTHALFLLRQAAKAGEARALARLAALTAAGAYVPQDWTQALALLGQAAAAGDPAAQGQLASLHGATNSSNIAAEWTALAARVPLQYWLQPAPEEHLHENVRRIAELAPAAVCSWLIERARHRLQPALVYDSVSRENQLHEMRSNTMALFDYANFDVVQFLVQARMSRSCGYPMQHFEAPMVLHYDVGQQITPHFDFIDARAADYARQIAEHGQRMVTFLLYLNDDYDGGETTFPELGIVNRGHTGSGLYFINAHTDLSPDRRMLHTGSPPTRGEKWIVSQFIVSKQLRP
ncbi:MAG: prolyl hydroxylase family protein [Pseudohongiellaceae bacterium]